MSCAIEASSYTTVSVEALLVLERSQASFFRAALFFVFHFITRHDGPISLDFNTTWYPVHVTWLKNYPPPLLCLMHCSISLGWLLTSCISLSLSLSNVCCVSMYQAVPHERMQSKQLKSLRTMMVLGYAFEWWNMSFPSQVIELWIHCLCRNSKSRIQEAKLLSWKCRSSNNLGMKLMKEVRFCVNVIVI